MSSWHTSFSTAASGQAANGSAGAPEAAADSGEAGASGQAAQGEAAGSSGEEEVTPMTPEETVARLEELEQLLGHEQTHAKEAKDQMLLCLADMENLRARSAQQVENNRKFAIQGFVKQVLEVADNLERAAEAVPQAALTSSDAAELQKQLTMLLEGVQMTQRVLNHALKMNGVESYRPHGEQFDPNLHSALFQLPDPSKTPGTVSVVAKTGYKMHDRVLRAAEVGVVAG